MGCTGGDNRAQAARAGTCEASQNAASGALSVSATPASGSGRACARCSVCESFPCRKGVIPRRRNSRRRKRGMRDRPGGAPQAHCVDHRRRFTKRAPRASRASTERLRRAREQPSRAARLRAPERPQAPSAPSRSPLTQGQETSTPELKCDTLCAEWPNESGRVSSVGNPGGGGTRTAGENQPRSTPLEQKQHPQTRHSFLRRFDEKPVQKAHLQSSEWSSVRRKSSDSKPKYAPFISMACPCVCVLHTNASLRLGSLSWRNRGFPVPPPRAQGRARQLRLAHMLGVSPRP